MNKKTTLITRPYLPTIKVLPWYSGCLLAIMLMANVADAAPPVITHLNTPSAAGNQALTVKANGSSTVGDKVKELAAQLPQLLDSNVANSNVMSQLTPTQRNAVASLMEQTGDTQLRIRVRQGVGTIRYLKVADFSKKLKLAYSRLASGKDRDKRTASDFLQENHELLNITEPSSEFVLRRRQKDKLGRVRLRYQQQFQGIPVWPSEAQVHLDPDGNVDLFEGSYIPTPSRLSIQPQVTAEQARLAARQAAPNASAEQVGAAALIIYALDNSPARLAWKMDVNVALNQHWLVVIDALDGSVLTAFNQVADAGVKGSGSDLFGKQKPLNVWQDKQTFFMVDTSKKMFSPATDPLDPNSLQGGIVILDAHNTSPDNGSLSLRSVTSPKANAWSLKDAVSASYGLSKTYDYYLSQHRRNSLDGKGGNLIGVVRFQRGLENAFWNGKLMVFGDKYKYAGALDVVGHELTHGVTQHTAGLVYKNQSGAMNEAFSDIFGQSVENFVTHKVNWLLAETILPKPLRDMKNPGSLSFAPGQPFPSKMSEFFSTNQDNGGVHLNSGIINRAFYLLAEGLDNAIGNKNAEKIFYRALSKHLVSNSQFIDARLACIQSAEELFGANSTQAKATAAAFDGVEIFDDSGTPDKPNKLPSVSGKDATLFVFTYQGQFYLGRREGSDPATGVALSAVPVFPRRPVVSGDGSLAVFVSADRDLCAVATDGSEPAQCLGFSGTVYSVAMTPDASRWAFVLADKSGNPSHQITIIDINTNTPKSYDLIAPVNDGNGYSIAYADSMDFSVDGRTLIYDALTNINQAGAGQTQVWAMYALDLPSETFTSLMPPTAGLAVGNPSFSQTSDSILAFEASNEQTGETGVFAANLLSGKVSQIGQSNQCCTLPGYNGDDSAIIFAAYDPRQTIGFSLFRQPVGKDWLRPSGKASAWLTNTYAGTIYRRGDFQAPKAKTVAIPNTLAFGTAKGLKSTVTIINKGSASFSLGHVALVPASKFAITKDGCTGVNLVPSGKCRVEALFRGGTGLIAGRLKIPLIETGKKLTVALSGGIKLQVNKATLKFNPKTRKGDQFTINGKLAGTGRVKPASVKSVTVSLGRFKQVVTRFTRTGKNLKFSSSKAGVSNLAVNLGTGRFSVSGKKLNLGKLSNPPEISLTLNKTMDCTKPRFKTRTGQWTFKKAAGQKQTSCTVLKK